MEHPEDLPPDTFLLEEQHHDERSLPHEEMSHTSAGSRHPKSTQNDSSKPLPTYLFRKSYLLLLVSLYGVLALVAWVILCIQNKRPITTRTYDYVSDNPDVYKGVLDGQMQRNADWFRTVKVLLAITNTLIIPLTSTVCASAAVVYIQTFGRRRHFSMRHTSTLADKGWLSPPVWLDLLTAKGWKSRASHFLVFAIAFHVLGFLIGPLQQYFIGEENFKYQSGSTPGLQNVADVFSFSREDFSYSAALATARLRSKLASVSNNEFQPNLWQEGTPQCAGNVSNTFKVSPECNQGGTNFNNISSLLGPYTVQLPAGYQTGLLTQFLPRINSLVSYVVVPQNQFPQNCATIPDAYYIEYVYNNTLLHLQVCMPTANSGSPWKATQDRQDISEEMYMDMNFGVVGDATGAKPPANQTFKVVVNTTLGYFALPNYNSSGIAGPLLAKGPDSYCNNTPQCTSDFSKPKKRSPPSYQHHEQQRRDPQSKRSLQISENTSGYIFGQTLNLGPLAMLTVALFDPGSFIATQFTPNDPKAFEDSKYLPAEQAPVIPCTVSPLSLLVGDEGVITGPCVKESSSQDDAYSSVSAWLAYFYDISVMQNALHAGVILAGQGWFNSITGTRDVYYDLGNESLRPKISTLGVVLVSILLAIDLFLLFALAAYAGFSYSWTSSYDSIAMMRQGAAMANELGLQVGDSEAKSVLERMPGWVGDAAPEQEVGVLAIGAEAPLRKGRKYVG